MAGFSPITYAMCLKKISSSASGISKLEIDDNNHLIVTYKDGTTQDCGEIKGQITTQIVSSLPTENISASIIYMLASTDGNGNDIYEEYIYVNNKWERLGTKSSATEEIKDNSAQAADIDELF